MKKFLLGLIIVAILVGASYYYTVEMEVPWTKNQEKTLFVNKDSKTFITNYNENDYIYMNIVEGNKLFIKSKTIKAYDSFLMDINRGEENLIRKTKDFQDEELVFGDEIQLEDGDYRLMVYYGTRNSEDTGTNYLSQIQIDIRLNQGDMEFLRPEVYENNLTKLMARNKVKKTYLSLDRYKKEERGKLKNLSSEITAGEEDTYKKAYLIANWVSNNIYYDQEAFKDKDPASNDPILTLENKHGLCGGYANLTDGLLRAANIPSRLTVGYGMGDSMEADLSWKDIDYKEDNHIWNEAYINGRWVIIDTTWNSNNQYIDGEFIESPADEIYFDMSIEFLSEKHRIGKRY